MQFRMHWHYLVTAPGRYITQNIYVFSVQSTSWDNGGDLVPSPFPQSGAALYQFLDYTTQQGYGNVTEN
jgi:hypothetical protein